MKARNEEHNRFASIIKLCVPTSSQDAKFPNYPFARETENFADSYADRFSSSPDSKPSSPTGIVMVSPPENYSSDHQHPEDEAVVFHTPPEQHHLSSEEQVPNELCAKGLDGHYRTKKRRVFEAELDDEPERKRIRVNEEEFGGETVPLGETEAIGVEGNEDRDDTEVIVLESAGSGDEMAAVSLGEDSLEISSKRGDIEVGTIDVAREVGMLMKDSMPKVDAVNGNHELGRKCMYVEGTVVDRGEKSNENSDLSGNLGSGRIEEIIIKLKCIAGNICTEGVRKSGVGGSKNVVKITKHAKMPDDNHRNGGLESDGKRIEENVVKITKDANMPEDGHRNGGLETNGKRIKEMAVEITSDAKMSEDGYQKGVLDMNGKRIEENGLKTPCKRIEEIDEFRYASDVDGKWKRRGGAVGGTSRRRQLPVSLKGKEKEVEDSAETKSGLLDFLDVLKAVVGDTDGDNEDVDFLETAKRWGLTFPRARWWPSEGNHE